jgi:hypothetical protein
MRIGVDFDNTIVCYDELFHRVAVERELIPASVPVAKGEVRGYLEARGQGDAWTELQGDVYGARLEEAPAFPGVLEFFGRCVREGLELYVISHKTRYPVIGRPHDLHRAAREWLERRGFFDPERIAMPRDAVFFELTQRDKVERIAQVGCAVFIDDLPEVLVHPGLPAPVRRILFDPHRRHAADERLCHTTSWTEVERLIRCGNALS